MVHNLRMVEIDPRQKQIRVAITLACLGRVIASDCLEHFSKNLIQVYKTHCFVAILTIDHKQILKNIRMP